MQYIPVTMAWGDKLRWAFTIFPSFCVTHGILFAASGSLIVSSRDENQTDDGVIIPEKLSSAVWDWQNLKGDAIILLAHAALGLVLLAFIELEISQIFTWCPRIGCRTCSKNERQGPVLVKDDDVIAEEERVA